MDYTTFSSPVGMITISTDNDAITGLHIEGDRYFTAIPNDWKQNNTHPLLQQVMSELAEYFQGTRDTFSVPVAPQGTPFQVAVWRALRGVPHGTTASYSDIADKINRPDAVRAVGTAIGRNPVCIIIPCHRVLAKGGGFGGFVAGVDCKKYLLQLENALQA